MIKVLLISIFFSVSLFAADSTGDFWIYSYGDITTLKNVFVYLTFLRSKADYLDLIAISILVGGIITVTIKAAFGIRGYAYYFGGATLILMLVFGTTSSVNIVNVKYYNHGVFNAASATQNNYARVDNVPYTFAIIASTFSKIGYWFTDDIESTFLDAGDTNATYIKNTSFLRAGFNGSFTIFNTLSRHQLKNMGTTAKTMVQSYRAYLRECIFPIAYAFSPDRMHSLLLYSNDLIEDLNTNDSTSQLRSIVNLSSEEVYFKESLVTCGALYSTTKTAYDELKSSTNDEITKFFNTVLSRSSYQPEQAAGSVLSLYTQVNGDDSATKIKNYILNTALMKNLAYEFSSGTDNVTGGGNNSTNGVDNKAFATSLSTGHFITSSRISGQFAAEQLPYMQEVIRAFMYVGFPILLLVQIVAGGYKIAQNYVLAMLWVELWAPSFAILNYFVLKETSEQATNQLTASSQDGTLTGFINIASIDPLLEMIASQSAIASNWFWMIPMLTGFLLFGGMHALMGLASSMASYATQGANLDYQQQKLAQQNAFEANKNKVDEGYAGAESLAFNVSSASTVSTSSDMLGQIKEFGGSNALAGMKFNSGTLSAANEKGTNIGVNKNSQFDSALAIGTKKDADTQLLESTGGLNGLSSLEQDRTRLNTETDIKNFDLHGTDTLVETNVWEKGASVAKVEGQQNANNNLETFMNTTRGTSQVNSSTEKTNLENHGVDNLTNLNTTNTSKSISQLTGELDAHNNSLTNLLNNTEDMARKEELQKISTNKYTNDDVFDSKGKANAADLNATNAAINEFGYETFNDQAIQSATNKLKNEIGTNKAFSESTDKEIINSSFNQTSDNIQNNNSRLKNLTEVANLTGTTVKKLREKSFDAQNKEIISDQNALAETQGNFETSQYLEQKFVNKYNETSANVTNAQKYTDDAMEKGISVKEHLDNVNVGLANSKISNDYGVAKIGLTEDGDTIAESAYKNEIDKITSTEVAKNYANRFYNGNLRTYSTAINEFNEESTLSNLLAVGAGANRFNVDTLTYQTRAKLTNVNYSNPKGTYSGSIDTSGNDIISTTQQQDGDALLTKTKGRNGKTLTWEKNNSGKLTTGVEVRNAGTEIAVQAQEAMNIDRQTAQANAISAKAGFQVVKDVITGFFTMGAVKGKK